MTTKKQIFTDPIFRKGHPHNLHEARGKKKQQLQKEISKEHAADIDAAYEEYSRFDLEEDWFD